METDDVTDSTTQPKLFTESELRSLIDIVNSYNFLFAKANVLYYNLIKLIEDSNLELPPALQEASKQFLIEGKAYVEMVAKYNSTSTIH